jgi:hypothetical protein
MDTELRVLAERYLELKVDVRDLKELYDETVSALRLAMRGRKAVDTGGPKVLMRETKIKEYTVKARVEQRLYVKA